MDVDKKCINVLFLCIKKKIIRRQTLHFIRIDMSYLSNIIGVLIVFDMIKALFLFGNKINVKSLFNLKKMNFYFFLNLIFCINYTRF